MSQVFLLLLSSRVPYRRAKISFEPNGVQTFGQTAVPAAELEPGALEQLLADPHIIVFASFDGHGFWKVETPADIEIEEMAAAEQPEPVRDTATILAEAARLEAERTRAEAAGPEGDEQSGDDQPPANETETSSPPADGAGEIAPAAEAAPAKAKQPSGSGRKK